MTTKETRTKLLAIEEQAKARFIEREEEIRGLTLATLSGQHIFFVGSPGTAKSMMARWYCEQITGASYFTWLLTRFTTPEEVFGPVDLAGMKAGVFKRITAGKAPESHVAFLDELFKANSAILNTFLSWLQERIFHNNGTPTKCPLIFAVGASNELPEEDEALSALYDRFLIRYNVGYIKDRSKFLDLLQNDGKLAKVKNTPISLTELEEARKEVANMPVTPQMATALADLRDMLRKEGIINSDRRFIQALAVFKAQAWLEGKTQVDPDVIDIGGHIFWDKPEDARKVMGFCLKIADPNIFKAQTILEAAEDVASKILENANRTDDKYQGEVIAVTAQLKRLAIDMDAIANTPRIQEMAKKIRTINKEVAKKGMGWDV